MRPVRDQSVRLGAPPEPAFCPHCGQALNPSRVEALEKRLEDVDRRVSMHDRMTRMFRVAGS